MFDTSMSAIRFLTTHKVDLPHYLFIFRKSDPLVKYLNNAVWYRLGTMLYSEVKKGEEVKKTA